MMEGDFSGVKRSMHRKIKEAKAKGTNKIEISIDYLMNVSKTYDDLLDKYRWYKNPKMSIYIKGMKMPKWL